jgi:hypothetical protein
MGRKNGVNLRSMSASLHTFKYPNDLNEKYAHILL